jgi:transcriptional regulator with XRE-family HTH domain
VELAARAGMEAKTVAAVERKGRAPEYPTLVKLCRTLGVRWRFLANAEVDGAGPG